MMRGLVVPTEVFSLTSCGGSSGHASGHVRGLQVLFVPGNPGSASYFQRQIQLLHQAMRGQIDVLAVTHAGHSPDASSDLPLFSLDDQIVHKTEFIRQHIDTSRPLVIIGHSIGSFIACHCAHQLEAQGHPVKILSVISVFPFFWLSERPPWKVRGLALAASFYSTMGQLACLLSIAPLSTRISVIRAFTKRDQLDPEAIHTTAALLSSHSVTQNFFMGHTEFQAKGGLKQPPPLELLRSLGNRLRIFGCPEDDWLPKSSFEFLRDSLPDAKHVWIEDARHAFVTNEDQNVRVSREIEEELRHLSPAYMIESKL